MREVIIIDNFFEKEDFKLVQSSMKETKLYKYENHPDGGKNPENNFYANVPWVGKRSKLLHKERKDLFQLFWKTFCNKFDKFKGQQVNLYTYLHLRLEQDVKDKMHRDDATYSFLIYLSPSKFNCGTVLYDQEDNKILDVKYVENRALLFSSGYKHKASSFGNNKNNGRYTFNAFFRL